GGRCQSPGPATTRKGEAALWYNTGASVSRAGERTGEQGRVTAAREGANQRCQGAPCRPSLVRRLLHGRLRRGMCVEGLHCQTDEVGGVPRQEICRQVLDAQSAATPRPCRAQGCFRRRLEGRS